VPLTGCDTRGKSWQGIPLCTPDGQRQDRPHRSGSNLPCSRAVSWVMHALPVQSQSNLTSACNMRGKKTSRPHHPLGLHHKAVLRICIQLWALSDLQPLAFVPPVNGLLATVVCYTYAHNTSLVQRGSLVAGCCSAMGNNGGASVCEEAWDSAHHHDDTVLPQQPS
jgi:hypothetical protein